ncbi:MAG: GAF and ANTAR domain-containing protein [Gaiellales bacterium]
MADPREQDAAEVRLNRLLNLILETAVEVLGFDAATVTARHDKEVATVAATDQRMIELDDAQYESGAGPCLAVLDRPDSIRLEDAAEPDDRWEHFARTAAHLGVHSTLSVHMPVDSDGLAASLNLYSKQQLELNDAQVRAAMPFAEQLAAAMLSVEANRATAQLARDMAEAMRSRAVIEQAKGIIMADDQIDADAAFQRLVQISQHSNVKLRGVAHRIVHERTAPPDET